MTIGLTALLASGMVVAGSPAAGTDASVPGSAADVKPLGEGATAPSATLREPTGGDIVLADLYARGPTMLIFYRGGWCPYCNLHLGQIQAAEAEIRGLGFRVVAISPDRPEELRASLTKTKLSYQVLSDSDMTLTRAFGLAFRVDGATLTRYEDYGIDLEKASGRDHHLLPVPAVYLIDREGLIRFAHWNPDYKTRLTADELISAARRMADG